MKLGMIAPSHNGAGIAAVAALGLKYIEFDVNADDVSYFKPEMFKAPLAEHGVSVGAIGRWGRDRINADGSINKKEQADEFALIDACAELGCPVYITGCNYVSGLSYYANITAAIGYFQSLIGYSAGRVKICTYNCEWNNYVNKPKEWDIIHGHIPELGIKFDPSHTINGGRDYLSEAVGYATRFDHVHIKGTINQNGIHVDDPPAGLDSVNWGAFISVLRRYNYSGMLSIEPHSQTWQGELGEKGLRYTKSFMKKLLLED